MLADAGREGEVSIVDEVVNSCVNAERVACRDVRGDGEIVMRRIHDRRAHRGDQGTVCSSAVRIEGRCDAAYCIRNPVGVIGVVEFGRNRNSVTNSVRLESHGRLGKVAASADST